jgi:hypothetical protein
MVEFKKAIVFKQNNNREKQGQFILHGNCVSTFLERSRMDYGLHLKKKAYPVLKACLR